MTVFLVTNAVVCDDSIWQKWWLPHQKDRASDFYRGYKIVHWTWYCEGELSYLSMQQRMLYYWH